jgi:ATP-dependent Lhr-like helicase
MHPRLVELVRAHRSTLIFANSRRLAERLAAAINEIAGATIARSHHGSLAREQRADIEDQLKRGALPALVATSSLELGIDMGAIDLVIQVEAPPSVASGLQRIGRAGHQVDAESEGVIFPKFRGDLLACAAVARAMREGRVESTRYPRNPLDVLAQQIVAAVAMDDWTVDDLYALVRRAAGFDALGRDAFEGVLDMLSGRYPSDEFAELRPRLTWDRSRGRLTGRAGAKRLAIANAGTIPDRGLYGVFLAAGGRRGVRVGELDEEMVFETKVGEVFVLGASSWRVEAITHDRVLVSPAPGEPGKTPFWKGDRPGRPLELGLRVGELTRDLLRLPIPAALSRLTTHHDLDPAAAEHLVRYVRDQAAAGAVPDADTVVIERVRDELGDWRVCLLSPRGSRVHAPWCMAVVAKIRAETGVDVETLWSDDGFVVRFPDVDRAPDPSLFAIDPDEVEALVVGQIGATALFAARFRENAGRSLLLPRRRAGQRAPLWQQRKKATDLLGVAAKFGSFPVLLETYRECLRDVFDLPALVETLRGLRSGALALEVVDPPHPTPFAASLLFGYVANFLYDGDAPLAERRAQALAVDQAQLRELIGDAELRDLFDAEEMAAVEAELQRLEPERHARSADGVHDLLLELGDLTAEQLHVRMRADVPRSVVDELVRAHRVVEVRVAGEPRLAAVEDAARYRDGLGAPMPRGVPAALRAPAGDPLLDLVSRFARTHAPFVVADLARRFGLPEADLQPPLAALEARGRLVQGAFTPGRSSREWCDTGVLRRLRRRSLARLRKQVAAVDPETLARFAVAWQGLGATRRGPDALLDVIEQLQGAPLAASILESEILAARLPGYSPEWLDTLAAAGEVVWCGIEPLGQRDGRIALFLSDRAAELMPAPADEALDGQEQRLLDLLAAHGAMFFADLVRAAGDPYPGDVVDALWRLVWKRRVTSDAFHALRARVEPPGRHRRGTPRATFRSRRAVPRDAEGRWTLSQPSAPRSPTERMTSLARQLLARHGVLTREAVVAENVPGGFSAIYPALRALDDAGQVRRGYFVEGLGATQFALPGAIDLLRALRAGRDESPPAIEIAATDPANPYGASVRWPVAGPARVVGAQVLLVDGGLAAYVPRAGRDLTVALPDDEPRRSLVARAVAARLASRGGDDDAAAGRGLLIERVNGEPAPEHPIAPALLAAGFICAGGALLLPVAASRALV